MTDFSRYLYELNDVNLGRCSPSEARVARAASEMLQVLSEPQLDLSPTAEDVPEGLSTGTLRQFSHRSDSIRTLPQARAVRSSFLPWSTAIACVSCALQGRRPPHQSQSRSAHDRNCLRKRARRDDILSAGPFGNASCRLQDSAEMEAIEMEQAFKSTVVLVPEGILIL